MTNNGGFMDGFLTIKQAADALGITPSGVHQALRNRRMTGERKGRDWYIAQNEVERYKAEPRKRGPKTRAQKEAERTSAAGI